MAKLNNKAEFFNTLRRGNLLGPDLTLNEVQGTEAIVDACAAANWPMSWVAYALATAYHETAHTMLPIKEMGGNAYFTRMYDITGNRRQMAINHGNKTPGDGPKYAGRGYVQLTWKSNYIKAGNKLGIDLVNKPDLAMDKKHAADILVFGMQEGWFTGKSNEDYMPNEWGNTEQFKEARRIINGTDKRDLIAGYASQFQTALDDGLYRR